MDFEKYTERAKGFVQAAQTLAQRRGHQQITPEHLLKVLIEDKEGLCSNLIRAAGGEPKTVLSAVDAALDKLPRVEGGGPARSISRPSSTGSSTRPRRSPRKPATASSPSSGCCSP